MIVVDASAMLELLLQTGDAARVEARLFAPDEMWHAPHLIDLEIAQVLRRAVTLRQLSAERGRSAVDDLTELPLTRHPHTLLLPRIWELRENVTAYDAAYLALAEALAAPLVTRDRGLASSVGHRATVELL